MKAFYQTFYQNEQLFRLADEPWSVVPPVTPAPPAPDPVPVAPVEPVADALLVDTEALVAPLPEPAGVPEPPARPALLVPEPVPAPLVPTPAEPPRPAPPKLSQQILILVDEELLPSDLLFLEKILNAINLDINGVDLLNIHGLRDVDFQRVLADKAIHHFFTFGVPFQKINLDILMDRYAPVRFDGITFMMADSLATIEADKALKRRLWEALKRIFSWK